MNKEQRVLQTPENPAQYFAPYIEAIAKHQVPGQDDAAAKAACVYEEEDKTVGPNRHYWIDYKFTTSSGNGIFLRFQHAGHIPANNVFWETGRGQVYYYMSKKYGLMLLYSENGNVWFNFFSSPHEDNYYAKVPTMPNVDVSTFPKRVSHGLLDEHLENKTQDYSNKVRRIITEAIDKLNTGQTLPPEPCEDWNDAEGKLNRLGATHFPEYLTYLLHELSQATGIMSFPDWVKTQASSKETSNDSERLE